MEDTPYNALLLTPNGLKVANALFGPANSALRVGSDSERDVVIKLAGTIIS